MSDSREGPAIVQVLPVLSPGDAIGNAVLRTDASLRAHGIPTGIYADRIGPQLTHIARPVGELLGALRPRDAVLYHLSIGSPVANLVERSGARLLLVYHNITPQEWYRGVSEEVAYWLARGRTELRRLAPRAEIVIADSPFNAGEAEAAGARRTAVAPPLVDLERLRPRQAIPEAPPTILSVGRIAPNKRLDVLIRALAALRATDSPDARLHLCGGSHDTGDLVVRLRALADGLGVGDAVTLSGAGVSDAQLGALYASASVYACASDHEGFCVPVVEAMAFSLPVVAAARGALPTTCGDGALLLNDQDPLVWAAALGRAITDEQLRGRLSAAGGRRVAALTGPAAESALLDALNLVGCGA